MEIEPIAVIYSDYNDKFGIPRQSGVVSENISKIVFNEKYRDENYIRGIEEFSHLWLIWNFSENNGKKCSPTVRPPRLGGNKRVGVFATRSPFRPNFLGLSSVKLLKVEKDPKFGKVLFVSGADLLNNTPIFDIKPYLSYTDSHPDAVCGFTEEISDSKLEVIDECSALDIFDRDKKAEIINVLSNDIRPAYQNDKDRIYGFNYGGNEIKFRIEDTKLIIVSIFSEYN